MLEQHATVHFLCLILACALGEQGTTRVPFHSTLQEHYPVYSIPAILLADSTVLSSNMAIVIGPTPPGTGLIHPAF
jgi:hypothetical protein